MILYGGVMVGCCCAHETSALPVAALNAAPNVNTNNILLGSDGKPYLGPEGPAPDVRDREVVTFDGRRLIMRWVDPEIATRYGTSVYVRCGAPGTTGRNARPVES